MNPFFSEMRAVLGAAAIAMLAPIAACSIPLDDGHFACARGPCPANLYCHSDRLCYAAPEPDAGIGMDAPASDARASDDAGADASIDAADTATSDAPDTNLAADAELDASIPPDTSLEPGPDATADTDLADAFAPMDVGEDAPSDVGVDASFDGGTDAPIDVGSDVFSFDTRRDANADPGFFSVCRSNDECVSRSCYFPNAEPYTFGYCTHSCSGSGSCSATGGISARCRSSSCVVECSSSAPCPSGSRCLMTSTTSGVCLASGLAPLPVPALSCGGGMFCTVGECIRSTCRRRCIDSTNCADGWRCVNLAGDNVCVTP